MAYLKRTAIVTAAVVAAGLAWPPVAGAQTAQQPAQQGQTANFDQQQLKTYAVAALEVQQIRQSYAAKLQGASPQEQQSLQQEAMGKMSEAVQSKGLDVSTYNEITQAAQNDPGLANEIQGYIQAQ